MNKETEPSDLQKRLNAEILVMNMMAHENFLQNLPLTGRELLSQKALLEELFSAAAR
ncbi:MAG: hypothetical protein IJP37_05885 [Clostridia bacterium]|nr:hypothetical protein [Clostridia bacterium]MBR0026671.1 hypothetical protein [Clostridia bacterium]